MAEPVGGRISQELRHVVESADLTQPEVADKLEVSQSTVSDWVRGARMPPIRAIALIEELAGAPKGTVLRRAGYVEDGIDLRGAILSASELTPRQRNVLVDVYDSLRIRSAPSVMAAETPAIKSTKRSKRSSR